jgi:hypothetical protein
MKRQCSVCFLFYKRVSGHRTEMAGCGCGCGWGGGSTSLWLCNSQFYSFVSTLRMLLRDVKSLSILTSFSPRKTAPPPHQITAHCTQHHPNTASRHPSAGRSLNFPTPLHIATRLATHTAPRIPTHTHTHATRSQTKAPAFSRSPRFSPEAVAPPHLAFLRDGF